MRNRVELLKQQLQKEKDQTKKHRALTKEAIQKKIDVNRINQFVTHPLILSRSRKTAGARQKKYNSSARKTSTCAAPTKKSCRTSRKRSTW